MNEFELDLNIVRDLELQIDTNIYHGADGATFIPSVSTAGVISWTNDKSLPNPDPVNIKGPQGEQGPTGATFTPSVSTAGVISWTNDKSLPNPESVNIKGPQGQTGATGDSGATFIPSVSTAGVISWTNDKSLPNPESVNIKGPQGETGPAGVGVPSGGTTGQVLKKTSATDYATAWADDEGGLTILSYGSSTWAEFLAAYNKNAIVYCRASSNADPSIGTQGRMAFMAYVNLSGSTPTSVEFQYYRSVTTHSDAQQGDQVFVYKLDNAGTWTVTTREAYTKIAAGTALSSSYSSGVLTISNDAAVPSGGSDGQVLTKNSSGYGWAAVPAASNGLPTGGSTGQILRKVSGTNYDTEWAANHDLPSGGLYHYFLQKKTAYDYDTQWVAVHELPSGGTTGQVLTKNSNTAYDVSWTTPSGGGGGPTFFAVKNVGGTWQLDPNAQGDYQDITEVFADLGGGGKDFYLSDNYTYANPTTSTIGRFYRLEKAYVDANYDGHLVFNAIDIDNGVVKLKTFDLSQTAYAYVGFDYDTVTVTYTETTL